MSDSLQKPSQSNLSSHSFNVGQSRPTRLPYLRELLSGQGRRNRDRETVKSQGTYTQISNIPTIVSICNALSYQMYYHLFYHYHIQCNPPLMLYLLLGLGPTSQTTPIESPMIELNSPSGLANVVYSGIKYGELLKTSRSRSDDKIHGPPRRRRFRLTEEALEYFQQFSQVGLKMIY